MSDARKTTYEQLSALCAQMAAALGVSWNALNYYATTPCARDDLAAPAEILAALTAYRTLSPDPVWQRVPEGCVVVPEVPTDEMILAMHHQIDWCRNEQDTHEPEHESQQSVVYQGQPIGTTCKQDLLDAWAAALNRARGEG